MSEFPFLSLLILLPLAGAVSAVALRSRPAAAKLVALGSSLLALGVGIYLAIDFQVAGGMQHTEELEWISSLGAHYALGVDGLSLVMVLLTLVLVPLVLVSSWRDTNDASYYAWMLGLQAASLAVFTATDVFLFYVVFEVTLIPAYFLIGSFGRAEQGVRSRAALKFLLYQLAGGLVMLAAVIGLYVESAKAGDPSYLISDMAALNIDGEVGKWLFVGFFIAFAAKAPMFPLHTWLADTTAAATPGTSVLLVCVLDKIGTYGMLRFCLEIFPGASQWATPVVVVFALISIIYGALVAIGQDDILRLIGLTSLSHFGFIVLGIFVLNSQGGTGAIFYMLNHGLATAALFFVAGYIIQRKGTASIKAMSGMEKVAPILAGMFLIAGLATLGLPGLSPFISEFLVIVSAFQYAWYVGAVAVLAIVLAAIYVLWFYQRSMTGATPTVIEDMPDVNRREIAAVAPILVAMIFFGFYPAPVTDVINPYVADTLSHVGVVDEPPEVSPDAVPGVATDGEEAHQ